MVLQVDRSSVIRRVTLTLRYYHISKFPTIVSRSLNIFLPYPLMAQVSFFIFYGVSFSFPVLSFILLDSRVQQPKIVVRFGAFLVFFLIGEIYKYTQEVW